MKKMLNQFVLVGKLAKIVDKGDSAVITLATPRNYKNENGKFGTDYIDIVLTGGIAKNTIEYCKENDTIGVKGQIHTRNEELEKITELLAEKITFLTSNPNLKEDD